MTRSCGAQQTDQHSNHAVHPVESPQITQAFDIAVQGNLSDQRHGMTLDSLQSIGLANNPTIAQAIAQIEAARGAAYQAGLRPNPNVGYVAEQIGINGTSGELQGGFVSQEFVRGGKLELSRAKYCQRVQMAESNLLAQQARVSNDIAIHFYQTLAAQQALEIRQQIADTAADHAQTHRELLNTGQVGEAEVLHAEVEQQRELLKFQQSQNDFERSWRELMAFAGIPETPVQRLSGTLESIQSPIEWDTALAQLFASSPQLAVAHQKIQHDQLAVQRERVEPIPNVTVDFTVGHNVDANQTVTGVTAGFPLPVFNRNRGTIRQAEADLNRSYSEIDRLQLELRSELARQYRDYLSAWQHVQNYQQTMLPKSRAAVQLLEKSYIDRRAPWTTVLAAKRMLLDLELENIDNLLSFQKADIAIRGNLLMGGLTEPDGPISGGHIDAVAQPR